jgi:hypothetical protein
MKLASLKNILLGKHYMGIEHFSIDNEEKVAYLLVENKNNELKITNTNKYLFSDITTKKLDTKLPLFVSINTNQVIQKVISENDDADKKLLHKAFPNLLWDEFYYEIWRLKDKSIISISRKQYVDDLIFHYQKNNIAVAGVS